MRKGGGPQDASKKRHYAVFRPPLDAKERGDRRKKSGRRGKRTKEQSTKAALLGGDYTL